MNRPNKKPIRVKFSCCTLGERHGCLYGIIPLHVQGPNPRVTMFDHPETLCSRIRWMLMRNVEGNRGIVKTQVEFPFVIKGTVTLCNSPHID